MSNKLEDLGKSMELAMHIEGIKTHAFMMDLDYLKVAEEAFRRRASFQDSAAVLNPQYHPDKSNLLRLQAQALHHLHQFIETLKLCEEKKQQTNRHADQIAEIQKLFI